MINYPHIRQLLWFVFAGSRGGVNRLRIIAALQDAPKNTNQLANVLDLDYKAIQHHIKVLKDNNLVESAGQRYSVIYFVSTFLEENIKIFEEISKNWVKIHKE